MNKCEKLELISITPLWVSDLAIGQCWDKVKDNVDLKRMDRVANKFKHRSTIEHIYATWLTTNENLIEIFKQDRFSLVSENDTGTYITTNMRALGNMNLNKDLLINMLPEQYRFLVIDGIEPIYKNISSRSASPHMEIEGVYVSLLNVDRITPFVPLKHTVFNFHIKGITRSVLQELARHRVANFSVKSSRYTLSELKDEKSFRTIFGSTNKQIERAKKYVALTNDNKTNVAILKSLENLRKLAKSGKSNDIIKDAMPEAYRTDLVLTFTYDGLLNFLQLRLDKSAWYRIRNLARMMMDVLPIDINMEIENALALSKKH